MDSRDTKSSASPSLSDTPLNPSQPSYPYLRPALSSLPSNPTATPRTVTSNPITPSTTLLPNASHLTTQAQPLNSLPSPQAHSLFASRRKPHLRENMHRPSATVPTTHTKQSSSDSHQSHPRTLHALPSSSQPRPNLDPFSRPLPNSIMDAPDSMRLTHLPRAPPPLSSAPPQRFDLPNNHQQLVQEQQLRSQQPPPYNSTSSQDQLTHIQTRTAATNPLPSEPLPQMSLPQSSQQVSRSDVPDLRAVKASMQNLAPQPVNSRTPPASNDPSPGLSRSSAQQNRGTLGSPNQTSIQHSRPRSQFGQVQQSVESQRSLQPRQPPPLPPRPAMLAPPRGSLVMQDVPRYQRQVVPSVSSHPKHTSQAHDAGPPGDSRETCAVEITDRMIPHGSGVDHQARSIYHHGMLSNPRQIAPIPAMAQQMPGSPAVGIGSAQLNNQQRLTIPHGLEHHQPRGSIEDHGNSSTFPRELGKHDRSFSQAPVADLRAPVQRSSGQALSGIHRVNRIGVQGDEDMYVNPSVRASVESGTSSRCGEDKGARVFDTDSVTKPKPMRDDNYQNVLKPRRSQDELLSRSSDPSVLAPQRVSRHHRASGRSVDERTSIQEQPGGEHLAPEFHPAGEGATHNPGSRTVEGFATSPQVAGVGASRNLLELQTKVPSEDHLKKENSPKTNLKNLSKALQPAHPVTPTSNQFCRSPRERNMESSLPRPHNQDMNAPHGIDERRFQTDDNEWQQTIAEKDKPSNSFATNVVSGEPKDAIRSKWRNAQDLVAGMSDSKAKHDVQGHLLEPVSSQLEKTDTGRPTHPNVVAASRGSRPTNSSSRLSADMRQPANFISNQMDAEKATHRDTADDEPEKESDHVPERRDGPHCQSARMSLIDSKKKSGTKDGTMSQRQETNRSAAADENGSTQRKQLKVEDALAYLEKVKSQFSDQLSVYNQFLDIMKEFKADCIDTNEVIRRVSSLFRGHKDLILGFNTFLPPGYKIRVTENTKTGILSTGFHGPAGVFNPLPPHRKIPAKVTGPRLGSRKRGTSVSSPKEKESKNQGVAPDGPAGPSSPSIGTEQLEKEASVAPMSAATGRPTSTGGVKSTPVRRAHGFDTGNLHNSRALQQSVAKVGGTEARAHEFERAIGFVTAIKERFADSPDTFNEFLDALRRFREEQKSIREVFEAVADLFGPHKDLLSQFKEFIPTIAFSGIQETKAMRDRTPSHGPRRNQGSRVISESTPSKRPASFGGSALNGKMKPRHRVREMQFFEDLKAQLGASKAHLYTEFIKCLSLFSQGIVSKEELLHLTGEILRDDQDAQASFLDYLDAMANIDEGVFEGEHNFSSSVSSDGEPTAVDAARIAYYTSKPMSEIAAEAGIEQMHSYRRMPHDFPPCEYGGRSTQEKRTLNDTWINVTSGSEDYSFKFMRRNQNEDNLFRCEDDRYELDLVIETNASAIMKLETIVATISKLPLSEKKRHALAPGALTPIHFNAIQRIYGDNGPEVISQLKVNPSMAVPVILKRMKEKDITWRGARMDMNKVWREVGERNFHRSLDHRSSHFKAVDKKDISTKSLLMDILDPVTSVATREAEMTRARGYPVENGGGGANHRSQALKAVLAAAQQASDRSSRRLELKFEYFQVHRVVHRLLRDVVDDEVSKRSFQQFGEMIQNFFGVSFEENGNGASAKSFTTRANSEVALLYGDDSVYIVMRIYHLLFERVALAFDLAREQIADRERRAKLTEEGNRRLARKGNRASIETKPSQLTKTMNNPDADSKFSLGPTGESVEEICDQFLELAKQFVRAKLDWSRYEEKCRTLLGVDSYALFTIDKTVQKLIKGIETMFGGDSASAKGFCELFYECQQRLTDARVNGGRLDTEGIEVLYSVAASRHLAEVRGPGANLMRFQSSCEDNGRTTVLIHVIGQIGDEDRTRVIDAEKGVLDKFLEFCGSYGDCRAHGATRQSKEMVLSSKPRTGSSSNPDFSHAVKSKRGAGSRKQGLQKGGGCDFLRYRTTDRRVIELLRSTSMIINNGLEWRLDGDGLIRYATGTCDFLLNMGRKRAWDEGLNACTMNEECGRRKRMRRMLRLDEKGDDSRTEDRTTAKTNYALTELTDINRGNRETERHQREGDSTCEPDAERQSRSDDVGR